MEKTQLGALLSTKSVSVRTKDWGGANEKSEIPASRSSSVKGNCPLSTVTEKGPGLEVAILRVKVASSPRQMAVGPSIVTERAGHGSVLQLIVAVLFPQGPLLRATTSKSIGVSGARPSSR